jgi:hypothetical protein
MDYTYNYRIGLFIQRNGYIDAIYPKDMVSLYQIPSKMTFKPILLNEYTIQAYGFVKSNEKYKGFLPFFRNDIMIVMRPFTNKYYCVNIPVSMNFEYLHELQDFFEMMSPLPHQKLTSFPDFIIRYGSRYLDVRGR